MVLKKQNKKIRIQPKKNKFLFRGSKHCYLLDSPHTVKTMTRLYNKGFSEAFIDVKMIFALSMLGFIITLFFIF